MLKKPFDNSCEAYQETQRCISYCTEIKRNKYQKVIHLKVVDHRMIQELMVIKVR